MILQFFRRELGPGVAALEIKGNIHCGPECARLEREVDELLKDKFIRVVFDLSGVTHMDSAAIGSIVRCHTKLKAAGGALRLASVQPMISHSLQLTKVDRLVSVYPGVSEAAQNFASSGSSNPA